MSIQLPVSVEEPMEEYEVEFGVDFLESLG